METLCMIYKHQELTQTYLIEYLRFLCVSVIVILAYRENPVCSTDIYIYLYVLVIVMPDSPTGDWMIFFPSWYILANVYVKNEWKKQIIPEWRFELENYSF